MSGLRIGIDVGGTFTDFTLSDAEGRRLAGKKVLSTSPDPSEGVVAGFQALLVENGVIASDLGYLAHASTVASNLILERAGPRSALITTSGFHDVLYLQRQKRADLYDIFYDKPKPLVRRRDIFEVAERVLADGSILQPLDEKRLRDIFREIVERGIESVAVTLINSYVNPVHERRIAAIAADIAPLLRLSLSVDICPRWREYERSSTTVINAYVLPAVAGYLTRMENTLADPRSGIPLHIMQCSGGLARVESVARLPVAMVESGPAAGALLAGHIGRVTGRGKVIGFDMGGTTAKVSIVEDGEPLMVDEFEVASSSKSGTGGGLPINMPAVDLIEIGTGGGSIAHVETGVLRVGPRSAGSSPGPACYGLGGGLATVTDADLVLGHLDPDYFLAGELKLNAQRARDAIGNHIARPLGLSVEEAAQAIVAIADASMAHAARVATVKKGVDPRDFSIVAFGGAGPLHAAAIAKEIGVREVVVPCDAGAASASGLLVARVKFELARTLLIRLTPESLNALESAFGDLEKAGRSMLRESGVRDGHLVRVARMRQAGQGYEIAVDFPGGPLDSSVIADVRDRYTATYRQIYGYSEESPALEIVDVRLSAFGPRKDAAMKAADPALTATTQPTQRSIYRDGSFHLASIWRRERLSPGQTIRGPALIQDWDSMALIPIDASASIDDARNVIVHFSDGG